MNPNIQQSFTLPAFLSPEDEKTLLRLSRFVLTEFVKSARRKFSDSELAALGLLPEGAARLRQGVFVTLKKDEDLRGCIGSVVTDEPVHRSTIENTMNSAAHDPRFAPVTPDELERIHIEISVMTELTPVRSMDEIVIGRDGLVLRLGHRAGLFLPQVPVEWNWDLKTFLRELCRKAGLPPESHLQKDATLERFSAQVFGEK